jgi:phenylalanyl-tRNA synthetase alpha chain
MSQDIQKIIDQLSPLERKIIPFLNLTIIEIKEKAQIDNTELYRALKFLDNKGILKILKSSKTIIDLGTNGIYYLKNHLPERRLLIFLEQNKTLSIEEAKKLSKLSDNEFKVSLGALKGKALIEIKNGKLFLKASKEELSKKSFEEQFLESLPIELSSISPEQKHAFELLKNRKEIIEIKEKSEINYQLTDLGNKLLKTEIKSDLLENVTSETIKKWKNNKKFRAYDIKSPVPVIYGGKRHFVNQSIEYGKRIWLDLGFKEMTGPLIQTSFWNFDALFTPQDHPVRDLQDTFFIKNATGKLPNKEIVKKIKQAHESGVNKSKGWQYNWSDEEAKTVILRTHTTCLSAQTLSKLKPSDLPAKFFAIGKVFRNETVDWSHGFEFNQTEGIVIDKNLTFRHLLGYLTEFAKKMGFEKIRFQPAYFPYTEPSVEGAVWHEEKKEWLEVIAAGIFRPEVTTPLLGSPTPVLAWGPGFDRLMMMANDIKDMRNIYNNDIKDIRNKKVWIK